jgi:16S rRNA (guanine527-N7)-methyltransferase
VVHERRLEAAVPDLAGSLDVVTARALASLDQLLAWTHPLLTTGVTALFPKGRDAAAELTEARKSWKFKETLIPSRTDPSATIVRIDGPIEPQTP